MPGANLSLLEGPRKSYSETTTGKIGTPISKATWKAPFSKDHVLHVQLQSYLIKVMLWALFIEQNLRFLAGFMNDLY